jgi:ribonuclease HI
MGSLMPWRNAMLRGQRVLARVNADGTFMEKEGRVEIRYRADDTRAYHARTSNLVALEGPLSADDAVASTPPVKRVKVSTPAVAHPTNSWIAYTDGACTGNPGPAGSGTIVIAPGGKIRESYAYLGEGTNNVAELTAIMNALEATPKDEPLVVHTDSQYAIGVLSKGWKAKANGPLIERIRKALHGRGVRFVYVPGHAGVPLNERADELAREAIRTRSSRADGT